MLQLERITIWPDCRSDNLVRRAHALNARAAEDHYEAVHIHPDTAKQLQLSNGQKVLLTQTDIQVASEAIFDNTVPIGAAFIAGGTILAAQLGSSVGVITLAAKN